MKFGNKARLIAAAAALVVIIGAGAQAIAGGKACSSGSKSGCAAANMGMCTSSASATSACTDMKAKGTSAQKATPIKAGSMFPEGTMVTAVEVPGGMDLLFTGKDLVAVKTVLNQHITQCNTNKSCAGTTCNVTGTEQGVTLTIRGADAGQCCMGLVSTDSAVGPAGAAGSCCPSGKSTGASAKTTTASTVTKKS